MKKIFYLLNCIMLLGLSLETLQAQVQMGSTIYGEDYNELGSSVAISSDGNTMITGSPKDYRGYAQVFEWDGSDWQQIGDTLFGDDFNDRFGDQVSISADGSIIAVGAKFQDENGSGTGQVKIFEWNSSNANWSQKGLDLIGDHSGNNFGAALELSSDGLKLIVGSYRNSLIATYCGQVQVFAWNGSSWNQMGNSLYGTGLQDYFGKSVSISGNGNIIAVGAENYTNSQKGSAQTYQWNGSAWMAKGSSIVGDNNSDLFGVSVDLSYDGNIMIVGATHDDGGGSNSGQAKIFEWSGSSWVQKGGDINGSDSYDYFGRSVSISDDGLLIGIGAFGNGANTLDGEAKVYEWTGSQWSQLDNTLNPNSIGSYFGYDVCVASQNKRIVVGANQSFDVGIRTGAVYVYEFVDDCDWEKQTSLQINGESASDQFGGALSYSAKGNYLIAGAAYGDGNGSNSGEVRIFEKNGTTWSQRGATLLGEAAGDRFGIAVAISNDGRYAIVGATFNDGGGQNSGHVRVFKWNGSNYVQYGADIDGAASFDYMGYSVDISSSGKYFVVGSPYNDQGNGSASGKVQVYKLSSYNHVPLGGPIYGIASAEYFGRKVKISSKGFRVAVGIPENSDYGFRTGQVRIYDYNNYSNSWTQVGGSISGINPNDYFGNAIAFSDDAKTIAVGAYSADPNGSASGEVKIFTYFGNNWIQKGSTLEGDAAGDNFGIGLDISASGDRVVVGAPYSDLNGSASGHIKVYDYVSSAWGVSGNITRGDNSGDYFGNVISISSDGTSIAVGARGDDDGGNYSGSVQIVETCSSNLKSFNQNTVMDDELEENIEYSLRESEEIQLYPNPTVGLLEIVGISSESVDVQVFNNLGVLVFSETVTGNTFNIEALSSGIYHVILSANGLQYKMKVLKK